MKMFEGPKTLKQFRIGFGKQITSYPKYADAFQENYQYKTDKVVVDGNLVTSQGPGTAFDFGLKIVELLFNADKKKQVADMLRVHV